jgi:hypothetical protein
VNEVGSPDQVPGVAVNVDPTVSVPIRMFGGALAVGDPGGPVTTFESAELEVAAPSRFRPVTVTLSDESRSPVVTV